ACHNLLLTRLTLGKVKDCLAMLPRAIQLGPSREQKRLFSLLHELLRNYQEHTPAAGDMRPLLMLDPDSPLAPITDPADQRLIELFRSLGQIEVTFNLLRALAGARPNSQAVGVGYLEAAIIKARDLMNRCLWTEARWLLGPLTLERGAPRPQQAALHNLLG